ncbi:hypothetical protein JI721_12850 [Alicyclobacillus cycloheptanicus]|uniref:Ferric iron reductase protein FhuF n=1 Tax=Alicyclobacillus cycloheptanicus TaxID=1457 RepID=A0ABT9XEM7_9BACL|nr:IucA/IucC family C-terminal-domain containing protein [Alicyclobacillus cycloheptanicus]MDQ0188753.1 ferric iron reductase protein FhuF [Alicyclobacillus cycloheptanicus]WDM00587.1 hypothetical protein JI721_12850 [Alicyclobacillus cycloheptanicus]
MPMGLDDIERSFRISFNKREDALFSMSMAGFLERDRLLSILCAYRDSLQASDLAVAAVSFSRWFAFLAAGMHYFLSVHNVAIDLSLSNLHVEAVPAEQGYGFYFPLNAWSDEAAPTVASLRNAWRRRVLRTFYGNTVRPVLDTLATHAGIRVGPLWGQIPSRLIWFVGKFAEGQNALVQTRVKADFECLKTELAPEVFGRKQNPFALRLRWVESLEGAGEKVYVFPACCLNYAREQGVHCYACPRLTEAQRAAMRAEFRASRH